MGNVTRSTMTTGQTRIYSKYYFATILIIMNVNTAIPASRTVVNAVLCFLLLHVPKPTFMRTNDSKMRMKSFGTA